MLISLSSLTAMDQIQKNIKTKVRPEGLININIKKWQIRRHLWKLSIKCM